MRQILRITAIVSLFATVLAACGAPATQVPTAAPQATSAPAGPTAPAPTSAAAPTSAPSAQADLAAIKTYLTGKTAELQTATAVLKQLSDQYYTLAQGANFDYAALWQGKKDELVKTIEDGRKAWMQASPIYEQMEGIVAGTPSLAQFDVDMDAGASQEQDPENAVSFDLKLPDGRTLEKPGNLFGVTESTLWGTFDAYRVTTVQADFNGDDTVAFGEALPDANVLKGGVDVLAQQASDLNAAAQAWEPTDSDAFTALVVMTPTMSEYFAAWRDSRFVTGDTSIQRDFVAISRLADMQDILSSLQVVHAGVSPLIKSVDAAQDKQIEQGLVDLKAFVADVYAQEQGGKRFTPEEADTLGVEAQNRATAITGQVTQVAGLLGITIAE